MFEAVPNISEGRDQSVISELASILESAKSVKLLDVSSQVDANRTVFTYAGGDIEEATLRFAARCYELIDMNKYSGVHPHIGALDVLPFVPLGDSSMLDAQRLAQRVGERIASEHGVPVYFYGEGRELNQIRRGKNLEPDLGKANPKTGGTCVGARDVLIAYNVSLDTRELETAKQIAQMIREKNSGLPGVKAIGWLMESYGHTQVSMNLTNYKQAGLYEAYLACEREAANRNTKVIGSELIGLIPEAALYPVTEAKLTSPKSRDEAIVLAREVLGLELRNQTIESRLGA